MTFEFQPEKALEALVYVAQRTPGHDMYKALKSLYIADKLHLAKYGRLIYGERYKALEHGPVPDAAYDSAKALIGELKNPPIDKQLLEVALERSGRKLKALRDPDLEELSKSDVECLDEAIRELYYDSFNSTKAKTHDAAYKQTPYKGYLTLEALIDALPEDRRAPVREYLAH